MTDDFRLPSASAFNLRNIPKHEESGKDALIVRSDGAIQIGGVTLTRVGIVFDSAVPAGQWEQIGKFIMSMEGAIQWLIGDYLLQSERIYNKTYKEVAEEWGRTVGTIYNYYYVVASVDFSLRNEKLTFNHHYAVAKLVPELQAYWLGRAEQEGWSVAQLMSAIKAADTPTLSAGDQLESKTMRDVMRFERAMIKWRDRVGDQERAEVARRLRELADYFEGSTG